MCYPNKVDIVYTPILTQDYLYRLQPSGHSHFRLNNAAWRAACEAGVALHRPIHRGCRGGARKQRPTNVIASTRPTVALTDTNSVNYDNITCVSVTPSPSMDHSEPGVDDSRVAVRVKLGIVNARSICNNTGVFTDYVTEVNMYLIAITETWLNIGKKDNKIIKDLTPADYKFVHLPRKSHRGGGVGLVYRSSFKVVVNRRDDMKYFEFMDVDVSSSGNFMKLVIIYRPPLSKKNKYSYADFLVECTGFIEHYALLTFRFAIVGDFNIHWDVPSANNVKRFADLLESLNIIQHVHAPTHIDGHTIDLILTPSGNHGITSTKKRCCSPITFGWNVSSTWRNRSFSGKQSRTESIKPLTNLRFVVTSPRLSRLQSHPANKQQLNLQTTTMWS